MARNNFLEGIRAGLQSYMQARKMREEEQRSAMEEQYKQMQMNELARKPEQPTLEEKNAAAWDLFQKKSTLTHQQRLEMTDKQNKARADAAAQSQANREKMRVEREKDRENRGTTGSGKDGKGSASIVGNKGISRFVEDKMIALGLGSRTPDTVQNYGPVIPGVFTETYPKAGIRQKILEELSGKPITDSTWPHIDAELAGTKVVLANADIIGKDSALQNHILDRATNWHLSQYQDPLYQGMEPPVSIDDAIKQTRLWVGMVKNGSIKGVGESPKPPTQKPIAPLNPPTAPGPVMPNNF